MATSYAPPAPPGTGVEVLLETLELRPEDAGLCLSIGEALEELGAFDEAERAYRRAIGIAPDEAETHRHHGVLLLQRGAHEEALAALERAAKLAPYDPDLHVLSAIAREEAGDEEGAVETLTAAVKRWPKHIEAHRQLGRLLGRLGALWSCVEAWEAVVELTGGEPEARLALAVALSSCGQHERALPLFEALAAEAPHSAEQHADLGSALHAAGRSDDAQRALEHALRLDPKLAQAHCALGLVLQEQGRLDDAVSAYRHAIELSPDWVVPHFNLGLALRAKSELRLAREALLRAEMLAPDDAEIVAALSEVRSQSAELLLPDLGKLLTSADEAGHTMSGDLSAFALPELLEFLRLHRATGRLVLDTTGGAGVMLIRRGAITAASSPSTHALDQQLWIAAQQASPAMRDRALRRAAGVGEDDPEILARMLIAEGAISATDARLTLEAQARAALEDMLSWRAGRFTFRRLDDAQAAALPEPLLDLDPQQVLLEVLRRRDEAGRRR